ncbi:MAG: hypothetical protein RLZ32_1162 [Gemmatimonadota bacterium]
MGPIPARYIPVVLAGLRPLPVTGDDPAVPDFARRLEHLLAPRFRIERELTGGGMSRVFVATETALGRRVVIKVLPPELAAGVNVERFHREIQLAAQLQHPHIVPLLDAGNADGLLWFSMPYLEGESLRPPVTRGERLPPREVVQLLHDLLEALAFAHARGVVHRDIKPGNVLTMGRTALVTDFGIAKALSAAAPAPGATATGMAMGTPAYMAPEQLAADPAADHRVDLYALGLLAYELLTGTSPFGGRTPQETLAAQLTLVPPPPHRLAPDVPRALSTLVMQCLEKDAARRPPSARAMLDTLDQLAQDAMGGGGRRGVRGVRAAALVLAVAAVGTLVVQVAGRRGDVPEAWRDADRPPADRGAAVLGGSARGDTWGRRDRGIDTAAGEGAVLLVTGGAETDLRMAEPVPVVLSRAESLAIAAAVRTRQASPPVARQPAARADTAAQDRERAALLEAVGKLFADSLARALQRARTDTASQRAARVLAADSGGARTRITPLLAPQRDGRARLVVLPYTNATGDRALAQAGRELVAALRGGVPADSVMVVDSATTALAIRASRDPMAVGWSLRADFVVSGMVLPRGDSVGLVTQFTDVRDGRFVRAAETVVSPARPAAGTAAALVQLRAWMDSARVVRTRRGTAAARGGGGAAGGPREGPPGPPRGDGPPRPPRG